MEKMEIRTENELETVVRTVLELLRETDHAGASLIALHGELGAGKTAFVKALAHALGVTEDVTSPTFVILKMYPLETPASFTLLAHMDAYRVEDLDEMRVLRFDELLARPDTLICVEWAENIAPLLPETAVHVHIAITGETRTITIH